MRAEKQTDGLVHKGKLYRERIHITTMVEVPFWLRLLNVFYPTIRISYEIYANVPVGSYHVEGTVTHLSCWDLIMGKIRGRRNIGTGLQAPSNAAHI